MPPFNSPEVDIESEENDDDEEHIYDEQEDFEIISDPEQLEYADYEENEMDDISPTLDDCKLLLQKHEESVFCVTVDPFARFIVSGAQDHSAIIWDLKTGSDLFICSGHEDSVIAVAFSPGGNLLATGDMSGIVNVWRCPDAMSDNNDNNWSFKCKQSLSDLLWLKWWTPPSLPGRETNKQQAQILLTGSEDGIITASLLTSDSKVDADISPKFLAGQGSAAIAAEIVPSTVLTNRPYIAVLYRSGDFRVWDLKTELTCLSISLQSEITRNAVTDETDVVMQSSFICMAAARPQSTGQVRDLVAIGATGQLIMIPCNPSTENIPKKLTRADLTFVHLESEGTVEAVDFSWTHPFLAFGTVDGGLGIFDISCMRMRQQWTYSSSAGDTIGFTSLKWNEKEAIFYTGTLRGTVVAWSGLSHEPIGVSHENAKPLAVWHGHTKAIFDLVISPNLSTEENSVLITASDDTSLRIFDLTLKSSEICLS